MFIRKRKSEILWMHGRPVLIRILIYVTFAATGSTSKNEGGMVNLSILFHSIAYIITKCRNFINTLGI
jgi:hypothetical protein